jgi:hypothetical protein
VSLAAVRISNLGRGKLKTTVRLAHRGATGSLGPTAMVGKPAIVATGEMLIVVSAGVGMEQLTECIASRRKYAGHG